MVDEIARMIIDSQSQVVSFIQQYNKTLDTTFEIQQHTGFPLESNIYSLCTRSILSTRVIGIGIKDLINHSINLHE